MVNLLIGGANLFIAASGGAVGCWVLGEEWLIRELVNWLGLICSSQHLGELLGAGYWVLGEEMVNWLIR